MLVRLSVQGSGSRAQDVEIEAASEADAVRTAIARGARVLAIQPAKQAPLAARRDRNVFPTMLFSQELLALLEAGLNLTEALATLHAKEQRPHIRQVMGDILRALREGRNFSDALARYPQYFPDVYIATTRASERTGDLPRALARYISYQLQFEGIRKKLVSAAIYPVMLLVVGGFVLLFLLGYVVPKFSVVYASSGRDLPWLSMALIAFGRMVNEHWPWVLGGVLAAGIAIAYMASQARLRAKVVHALLRLPALAHRADEFRLARCYRAVGLLLGAGVPLTRALGMVRDLLAKPQQVRLDLARRQVEEGHALSAALVTQQLANPVAQSLLKVGESSGRLGEMLERIAAFQDEELSRWIDWTSRLLEPVLMSFIGLVIGAVVVLMYIPIFELAGSLS